MIVDKYKTYIKENHKDIDPYGEEDWESDLSKLNENILKEFFDKFELKLAERIKQKFVNSLNKNKKEGLYEILLYGDDRSLIGVIKAESGFQAKILMSIKYNDVSMTSGMYESRFIEENEIPTRIIQLEKRIEEIHKIMGDFLHPVDLREEYA